MSGRFSGRHRVQNGVGLKACHSARGRELIPIGPSGPESQCLGWRANRDEIRPTMYGFTRDLSLRLNYEPEITHRLGKPALVWCASEETAAMPATLRGPDCCLHWCRFAPVSEWGPSARNVGPRSEATLRSVSCFIGEYSLVSTRCRGTHRTEALPKAAAF